MTVTYVLGFVDDTGLHVGETREVKDMRLFGQFMLLKD